LIGQLFYRERVICGAGAGAARIINFLLFTYRKLENNSVQAFVAAYDTD